MRTRCKFKVVSVEEIEGEISRKSFKGDYGTNIDEYGGLAGPEYTESQGLRNGEQYKWVPTGKYCQNVRLAAQYDSRDSEDMSFAAATPSGELKILVSNPVVVGSFRPGKSFYLDLIPCE
jgi:hypothetical protein